MQKIAFEAANELHCAVELMVSVVLYLWCEIGDR